MGRDPWERRVDLHGVNLVNCVIFNDTMVIELRDGNGTLVGSDGLFPEIVHTLGRRLNFTTTTMTSRDHRWGSAFPDGSSTGIVRELSEGVADISATPITMLLARDRVMDYSVDIMAERGAITTRRGRGVSLDFFAYVGLFTWKSWIFGAVFFLFSFFLLFVISQLLNVKMHKYGQKFGLMHAFGYMGLLILQLDYQIQFPRLSMRVLLISSSLVSFLLFGFYTALLTSLMTVSAAGQGEIKSLNDVYLRDYPMVAILHSGSYEKISQAHDGDVLQLLFNDRLKGKPGHLVSTVKAAYDRLVSEPGLVHFGHEFSFLGYDLKKLNILKLKDAGRTNLALGLQEQSEFRLLFNHHLLKMLQDGVIERLKIKWLPWEQSYDSSASGDHDNSAFVLGLENVLFPFMLLGGGGVIGLLLGGGEWLAKKAPRRLRRDNNEKTKMVRRSSFCAGKSEAQLRRKVYL